MRFNAFNWKLKTIFIRKIFYCDELTCILLHYIGVITQFYIIKKSSPGMNKRLARFHRVGTAVLN